MKKNDILKNIVIEKLVFGGKGFARLKSENIDLDGRAIFVTGGAIPGSKVDLRVLKKRKDYIETQIVNVVEKSPLEVEHKTNKYGFSGGWKWINIPYQEQLNIKQQQVEESLFHLKKLQNNISFEKIEGSPVVDGYRNKVEFSFGKYISGRDNRKEEFNVGFHKQGEFSKIEDMDGCPLIDEKQNEIFREIKNFLKQTGVGVYDTMTQKGCFRHLIFRKTYFTNKMMIILGYHPDFISDSDLKKISTYFAGLPKLHPEIASLYLSSNPGKGDTALGELECIYGDEYITESLHGLEFQISPRSFFQTNSQGAEKLYDMVLQSVKSSDKKPIVLDLYGGTGTIGMLFAKNGAEKVYSVEMVASASADGEKNAKKNGLSSIEFICAKVEDFLQDYLENDKKADLLVIDPPRAGMHPDALPNILKFGVKQIIYVSCNPATLARDLHFLLSNSDYSIEYVKTMDMFPHTHHIETIVSLVCNENKEIGTK